ncbi:hypothetical protein EON67_10345 [archaeon]|nr:MAG: hypothetical protein EON67_10345 [archaeon]
MTERAPSPTVTVVRRRDAAGTAAAPHAATVVTIPSSPTSSGGSNIAPPPGVVAPHPLPAPARVLSKEEAELRVVRIMFWAGCAALPWLWALVLMRYRHRWSDPHALPATRKCTSFSGCTGMSSLHFHLVLDAWVCASADLRLCVAGFCLSTAILIIWIAIFQTQWRKWGSTATDAMIYVPDTRWWWD